MLLNATLESALQLNEQFHTELVRALRHATGFEFPDVSVLQKRGNVIYYSDGRMIFLFDAVPLLIFERPVTSGLRGGMDAREDTCVMSRNVIRLYEADKKG